MATQLLYVWWDELDRRDMPCRCIVCGSKKATWIKGKFETTRYEAMRNWRVTRKTEFPVCSEHGGGWLQYVHSRDFDKQGAWISNACEEFIDALKEYRKAEIKTFKEEMEDEDLDDFDEHELPPGMRTPPEEPRTTAGQWLTLVLAGIVLLLVIGGFAVVCLCMGLGMFGMGGAALLKPR